MGEFIASEHRRLYGSKGFAECLLAARERAAQAAGCPRRGTVGSHRLGLAVGLPEGSLSLLPTPACPLQLSDSPGLFGARLRSDRAGTPKNSFALDTRWVRPALPGGTGGAQRSALGAVGDPRPGAPQPAPGGGERWEPAWGTEGGGWSGEHTPVCVQQRYGRTAQGRLPHAGIYEPSVISYLASRIRLSHLKSSLGGWGGGLSAGAPLAVLLSPLQSLFERD